MDEKLKGLLSRFKGQDKQESDDDAPDSVLFTRAFEGHGIDPSSLIPWEARAVEIGAASDIAIVVVSQSTAGGTTTGTTGLILAI